MRRKLIITKFHKLRSWQRGEKFSDVFNFFFINYGRRSIGAMFTGVHGEGGKMARGLRGGAGRARTDTKERAGRGSRCYHRAGTTSRRASTAARTATFSASQTTVL